MFLETIADHVREDLKSRRVKTPSSELRERPPFALPTRGFAASLAGRSQRRRHIVAEIKRASPSQGVIRQDFDPVKIAGDFAANGASALSVLTEERFFRGSLTYLEQIRSRVSIPLLRKDFTLDEYQLLEARSFGADAALLIVALLDPALLKELIAQAAALSLDALVEVHTESELERALEAGARLVGINNRDLKTFEVKLETTERLLPLVPPGIVVVCESGFHGAEQIERVEALGARVFLIGEALMRAPDPGAKLKELLT
ncbi:MAG TPA: indole-3-glycerol phosphate synthase TrpC [Candidatus Binatia bacterium]|jgi:indole-3-glycerol phosphate synthase